MAINIGDIQNAQLCCRMVQLALDDVTMHNTTFKVQNPGMIAGILSPQNRQGITTELDVQDPGGKNRQVDLLYWQNPRTAADTDCTPDICTGGDTVGQLAAVVDADLCRTVTLTLDPTQFRDFCGDGVNTSDFARQQTRALINQLLVAIDQDAITYFAANEGQFGGGVVGPQTIILLDENQAPVYSGGAEMAIAYENIEAMGGNPFVVGSGLIQTYQHATKMICCNDDGIDLSLGDPFNYFRDVRVDTTIAGQNNLLTWAPGALQMVSRTTYVGDYEEINHPREMKTTTEINILGTSLAVDTTVRKDFCGANNDGLTNWVITWTARFGFWSLPTDLEAAGSFFRNVNYLLRFQAQCGDVTCVDVPS